jgi:aminotransferase
LSPAERLPGRAPYPCILFLSTNIKVSRISTQVASIPRSGIRDFFELVMGRDDVISLGVGEPDFATPWHIREAAIYSLEKGETSYTSNLGLLSLRRAISQYVEDHFKTIYNPANEILVSVGVSEALDLAFRAILNPGDEVIFHTPCYVSYHPGIALAYGVAVEVPTQPENDFTLLAADVEKAITAKTKAIVLNFPTNPTGAIQPPAEMEKIAALVVKHDLIVLTDEIYSELLYTGEPHVSILAFEGVRERAVLLHGFSKAFAMTGFRLGYACAPPDLTEAMMKIHQYSMLCASITSQAAALEALKNGAGAVEGMRASYHQRRDMLLAGFRDMGLPCFVPGGAFYAFPDIRQTGLTSKEFAMQLLEKHSVAAVPGDAFGAPGAGFLRCCYATAPGLLKQALVSMKEFVKSL